MAENDQRMMLIDCTNGGVSAFSLERSQGHVSTFRYFEISSRMATAREAGSTRRTGILTFGNSQ